MTVAWVCLPGLEMHRACAHAGSMSKMIQIKHVPESVHRTLKARAAQAGLTLSDFLLSEISAVAERPVLEDLLARLRTRGPVGARVDSVAAVRAERESRR